MSDAAQLRHAVRVLLLDEDDRVLLFRAQDPETEIAFWFPPGGGREPGEDAETAAHRELREETGRADIELEHTTDQLTPRALATHLRRLLGEGPPRTPLTVGV